jgi:23S rRNA (cytidine1920-2'-O)/16S rRNA (cytidine1409-2'-O)-methyltransferase
MPFVSRAGNKLQFALDQFNISLKDLICADFGSSTGGFVDCLLKAGAKKVYSVDTAYGELAWILRRDTRVVVMERTNAMHLVLPEKIDFITIDVGWTKQKHILPNAFKNLKDDGKIISLIKPHYEIGKARVDENQIDDILEMVKGDIASVGAAELPAALRVL